MRNKVITIVFCLLLMAGLTLGLLRPDRYFSESEKRNLQQFPSLTMDALLSGSYQKQMETYYADQFAGRDQWVTIKTLSELALGKRENNNVYIARGGYLIDKFDGYSTALFQKNIAALQTLTKNMDQLYHIPVRVMLVPTAVEILEDRLPSFASHASQKDMADYAKHQGLDVIDVEESLKAHKKEYIYYKTDHHFTSLGAYYCYKAWEIHRGGLAEPLSDFNQKVLCSDFRGTTYSKVPLPFAAYDVLTAYYKKEQHLVSYNNGNYQTDSIYEKKYLQGKDQYAVYLNSNQSQTVIEGGGKGKLLILKDSYANTFSQFVVDDYEETHLIDLRFFRGSIQSYVKDYGITEVLVLYNLPNFSEDTMVAHCVN